MRDLKDMTIDEQTSYWVGHIAMAIGSGDVRTTVSSLIMSTSQDAYERGRLAATAAFDKQKANA